MLSILDRLCLSLYLAKEGQMKSGKSISSTILAVKTSSRIKEGMTAGSYPSRSIIASSFSRFKVSSSIVRFRGGRTSFGLSKTNTTGNTIRCTGRSCTLTSYKSYQLSSVGIRTVVQIFIIFSDSFRIRKITISEAI